MIKIEVTKEKIIISGHAGYSYVGKDIICSAVSSIVITTINGILRLEDTIKYEIEENKTTIEIIKETNINKTLITNMLEELNELASDYPKNIKFIK